MSEQPGASQQGDSAHPPPSAAPQGPTQPLAPSAKTPSRDRRLVLGGAVLLVVLAAVGGLWWSGWWRQPSAPPEAEKPSTAAPPKEFPLPAVSSSPFRNTGAEGQYVGSEACRSCHKSRTSTFRETGMGHSMAEVDAALAPADAVFDHPSSKRRYQITRKDGKLWHRELLLTAGTEEIVLAEYALKYVVGSGRQAHTYLVEADDFLVESPVSWYKGRQAWGMSPGYDRPDQQGFQRAIGESCLACHAGQATAKGKSEHRMQIQEAALSCERCHGPGSLHVADRTNHKAEPAPAAIDYTIVNPKHLSRELAEAVCQQCHLHSAITVLGRGRKYADYRPGLPLQDFRQDYWLDVSNQSMTVVGHVEQMHLSRCYKESQTFSCTTCHDPHGFPAPQEREAYYRAACLKCHQPERCTVPKDHLKRTSPSNNCVQCHMPGSPTEVPHVSSTHHRVAVHERLAKVTANPAQPAGSPGTLKPLLELGLLGDIDKQRSLGMAYLNVARAEKNATLAAQYQSQGVKSLSSVYGAGLRDPLLEVALALYSQSGQEKGLFLAESALTYADLVGVDRCAALTVVASERFQRKQYKEARLALYELVALRRHPDDWLLLASCESALRNQTATVEALLMAVRINPRLWQIHHQLEDYFKQQGDQLRAAWHHKRAVP
jgi:tetratricopeptide (TPR) repeat protein